MLKKIVIAAVALAAFGSTQGQAGTATVTQNGGQLDVNANVVASCNARQGTQVAFGDLKTLNSPLSATGTVTVNCDSGVEYALGLDTGSNASGSQRRMRYSNYPNDYFIPYELYSDAAHTTPITNIATGSTVTGVATGATPGGSGTGSDQTITIYGQIPAGPKPQPGLYQDRVTITVGF